MPENISTVFTIILVVLMCAFWILFFVRIAKNKLAPVKTVKAVVVDKFKTQSNIRKYGTFTRDQYTIVFSADGKKLSFRVSEFSYGGYRLNEKGTLKYKGNRIIDFS